MSLSVAQTQQQPVDARWAKLLIPDGEVITPHLGHQRLVPNRKLRLPTRWMAINANGQTMYFGLDDYRSLGTTKDGVIVIMPISLLFDDFKISPYVEITLASNPKPNLLDTSWCMADDGSIHYYIQEVDVRLMRAAEIVGLLVEEDIR